MLTILENLKHFQFLVSVAVAPLTFCLIDLPSFSSLFSYHREYAGKIQRPFTVRYDPYTQSIEVLDSVDEMVSMVGGLKDDLGLLTQALAKIQALQWSWEVVYYILTKSCISLSDDRIITAVCLHSYCGGLGVKFLLCVDEISCLKVWEVHALILAIKCRAERLGSLPLEGEINLYLNELMCITYDSAEFMYIGLSNVPWGIWSPLYYMHSCKY